MQHAETPFTVTVDRAAASVTVSVEDAGPGRPTLQSPAPTHPSGRGLRIVDALADSWGVTPRPDGNGKRVWFTLAMGRPDTPTRHEAIANTR